MVLAQLVSNRYGSHSPRVWLQIAQIRSLDVMRRKAFEKEIVRLSREGAIQALKSFEPKPLKENIAPFYSFPCYIND